MNRIKSINQDISRWKAFQLFLTILIAFPAITWSSWLTTKGLIDKAIEANVYNTIGMITAWGSGILVAVTLGTAVTIYTYGPKFMSVRAMIGFGIFLVPFIAGLSTLNNIIANAGPPSLVYNMRDQALQYENFFMDNGQDNSQIMNSKQPLAVMKTTICADAEAEKTSGHLTGSPGEGAVYASYSKICDSLGTVLGILDEGGGVINVNRNEAEELVTALEQIPNKDEISVFDRQLLFRTQSKKLLMLMKKTGNENGNGAVSRRINTQMEIMENFIHTVVDDNAFGKKQAKVLGNLQTQVANARKIIDGILELEKEEGKVGLRPFRLLYMQDAIFIHWWHNISQILLAILIDLLPLAFVPVMSHFLQKRIRVLEDESYELSKQKTE